MSLDEAREEFLRQWDLEPLMRQGPRFGDRGLDIMGDLMVI